MCGIVGIASRKPVVHREYLIAGRDAMHHRGPDDAGEWWDGDFRVGLAHRRLSIIDLSPAGHQPMVDAETGNVIVLNGEIYNFSDLRQDLLKKGHVFQSHSDTEVVLIAYREWGEACLARLNGMFAFAVYNTQQKKLFMARDRAGEKPLFYAHVGGSLCFASELKGLMAYHEVERRIDPEALDCYLATGFIPGDRCVLRGVNKLPPAHALEFDLQSAETKVWRYWELPEPPTGDTDEIMLLDELEALLEDTVRRQMVSDVPVGVLLSGGVDSSLVTAMAVRSASHVKTFTIRFPGHAQYDETEHARLIARHFSTEHVELEAAESTVDLLPILARQFDEPMVDSSMVPTFLVSKLIREHCTVALGGDGGDELFGGYSHYSRLLWLQKKLGGIPLGLRRPVAIAAEQFLPVGFKGRNWLQGMGVDLNHGLPLIATLFDRRERDFLLREGRLSGVAEAVRKNRIPEMSDLLQRATRMDFNNYLPEDILVKVDRASMLNSLEVRAPMLDYRIIEFAYGRVPSHLKATQTSRKVLLKQLCSRVLPPEFDQHRKQGFSIPLASWLQSGPWLSYFREVLLESGDAFFDPQAVGQLLEGQARGRSNSERLFALVLFQLWLREYRVSM